MESDLATIKSLKDVKFPKSQRPLYIHFYEPATTSQRRLARSIDGKFVLLNYFSRGGKEGRFAPARPTVSMGFDGQKSSGLEKMTGHGPGIGNPAVIDKQSITFISEFVNSPSNVRLTPHPQAIRRKRGRRKHIPHGAPCCGDSRVY